MSVEGVNNNSNAGLYTAGAAAVGGGAGALAGWYSKPYLKDGMPTDSFIKKVVENGVKDLPEDMKKVAEPIGEGLAKFVKMFNNAKSLEELKNGLFDYCKNDLKTMTKVLDDIGFKVIVKNLDDIEFEDIELKDFAKNFDESIAGKTIEQVKAEFKKGLFENEFLKQFWDADKKVFINCEEGAGKILKDAAKSIQGKYAAIYGGIGAAVLGLATLIGCSIKNSNDKTDGVDAQA